MKKYFLWGVMFMLLLGQVLAGGCAPKRWSPTDPRSLEPDTSQMTTDDSLTISLGTTVNASALP